MNQTLRDTWVRHPVLITAAALVLGVLLLAVLLVTLDTVINLIRR